MSIRVMTQVWDLVQLNQSQTLVLLALADHADDEGVCWPSIDRIAKKARLERRATQRIIRALEDAGYLHIDPPEVSGRGHTNRYTIDLLQKGVQKTPFPKKGVVNGTGRVSSGTGRVSSGAQKGVVAKTPESSITTNIEPSSREPSASLPLFEEEKKPKTRPLKSCPKDWFPTKEDVEWFKSQPFTFSMEKETAKFRDHEFRTGKTRWGAAWRNWMRGAAERKVANGGYVAPRVPRF